MMYNASILDKLSLIELEVFLDYAINFTHPINQNAKFETFLISIQEEIIRRYKGNKRAEAPTARFETR